LEIISDFNGEVNCIVGRVAKGRWGCDEFVEKKLE
jgi:hypothetical protein